MAKVFAAQRKRRKSQRIRANYFPPQTHHLKTFPMASLSIPFHSSSEYFLKMLFHKPPSLWACFHFLLASEKERGTEGRKPPMAKLTESEESHTGLLGGHWRGLRWLPRPLSVTSSRALWQHNGVGWRGKHNGAEVKAPICPLVHPFLPVGPWQGA